MYKRSLEAVVLKKLFKGKVLIIVGARQVGKTTLALNIIGKNSNISFNCDNFDDREKLSNVNLTFLKNLIGDSKIIFIDEGQKVESIGQTLKILVDHYKTSKQIIVTGSSAFNLLYKTQEPLTGRKFVYNLFPLSLSEMFGKNNLLELDKELENILIYGSYPDVINQNSFKNKRKILKEIASSYLYKDILEFQSIKSMDILMRILKAISLQIGQEVSYYELSRLIGLDLRTVERYINLLEQCFVIFRLPPYFKNKRKEISKMNKIYFYDLGIRNALIDNFNTLQNRNDIGQLFENLMIIERLKQREYKEIYATQYFWRSYDGAEVDLVEEKGGKLYGFEFTYNPKKRKSVPFLWKEYKNTSHKIISRQNLKGFVI